MSARDELLQLQPDEGWSAKSWAQEIDRILSEHREEVRCLLDPDFEGRIPGTDLIKVKRKK